MQSKEKLKAASLLDDSHVEYANLEEPEEEWDDKCWHIRNEILELPTLWKAPFVEVTTSVCASTFKVFHD